ncbi:MAG: rhomboid family intramembrane serine protease [Acidobacteria bacterium ACB1]|nr:Rhomboid protease GlpG [Pyrinomonadaceae bacterium]MCE7961787.1 rhomboid family intramembrane serine protease [Acidobacteria bacterium ACB1]
MSLDYRDEELGPEGSQQFERPRPREVAFRPGPPYYAIIIIALYTCVFLAELARGIQPAILAAGFDKQAYLLQGEHWRLLTGTALHAGLLHIGLNSLAFYSFARPFEALANRAHLSIVFLLSAVGGSVLTLLLSPVGISIGASGGIVGIIGFLAVYSFKRRQFIAPEFRRNLVVNIGFILLYGFVLSGIVDNYAHIGGLVTGAVYALFAVPGDPHKDPREALPPIKVAGLLAIAAYAAVCGLSILTILQIV